MRSLKRSQRARVKEHLDECAECQSVMVALTTKPEVLEAEDTLEKAG
jgi:predicted anti-sigma-YlaC factor YlaD